MHRNRRQVLTSVGAISLVSFAGCSSLAGDEDSEVSDMDGDGMIDSEDYAPRDPEVQEKSDLVNQDEDSEECSCPDQSQAAATEVDEFENGNTSGWEPVAELTSTFEASQERSLSGSWAAKFSEGSTKDNPKWEDSGSTATPDTVETAHALEDGGTFVDSTTEWLIGDTIVLRANYNWSNNFLAVNGSGGNPGDIEDGAVVADLPWPSSDDFVHVVLADIDWESHLVGEVRVNGTGQAENVPFMNETNGLDRTTIHIGGSGDNVVFIDDTTIPVE